MNRKTLIALVGALVIAGALAGAALAASTGPAVTVRIKTLSKTLRTAVVHGEKGWITKAHAPKGKCSGNSGAGALDAATHGKWTGTWSKTYNEYFVTSILGVKPKNKHFFWDIVVNGKPASTGMCEIKLRRHETILFKLAK